MILFIGALIAGGMQLAGGIGTGLAAAKQNALNAAAKKRLGWKLENIEELQDPIGQALLAGYKPQGGIRDAMMGARVAPAVLAAGQRDLKLRGAGGEGGAARRGKRFAELDKSLGHIQGTQLGGAAADTQLANMFLTNYDLESDFTPEKVSADRTNIPQFLTAIGGTLGKSFESTGAGNEQVEW